ncbi:MAG: prenyltransferase [Dethiobacter sp.]|jgi:1,4-dihydroxy-2-naphthoate octaprenyltransferase|nr:prenyltransferase [Dethiobacter sp.]
MTTNNLYYIPEATASDGQNTAAVNYRDWIVAARPWSFIMTAVSVTAGAILALTMSGRFYPLLALLTLAGTVAAHAATNLVNDYFDTVYGVDKQGAPTTQYRPHPLLDNVFSPHRVIMLSVALYAFSALIATYLTVLRGWPVAAIALAGGIISVTYTAGPVSLKYRGLGEIFVFLIWGPILTVGSYFVQTGSWSGSITALWTSLPLGIWVALVLLANNLKDLNYDAQTKIVFTTAIRLGREKGLKLFTLLLFSAYSLTVLAIVLGHLPALAIIVFFSLPMALRLLGSFRNARDLPADADPQTAQLSAVFGALLILSLLMGYIISLF